MFIIYALCSSCIIYYEKIKEFINPRNYIYFPTYYKRKISGLLMYYDLDYKCANLYII